VALLAGYLSWIILEYFGVKEKATKPLEKSKKVERKSKQKKTERTGFRLTARHVYMAFGVVFVFFLVFFPNIPSAAATAAEVAFAPRDAWVESLTWMKDNTPDPFGDPDFYYNMYKTPFHYPETAYGVAALWDSGYWIIRIGHRLPVNDPGGGARQRVARFFTAWDEASANEIMDGMRLKYIVIDYAATTGKFYGVLSYAGKSEGEFYETYYQRQGNTMVPGALFYPEYYRSIAVRLYNFDALEVIPQSSTVISYAEKVRQDGMHYKEILTTQSFPNYEEAQDYISKQKSGNYKIVGNNPFISPVPLKALEHYKLVHGSDFHIPQQGLGTIPEVKIFECTK
jgi:asparagine N-glycosylation enzyme membrane subunit Stt3